MSVIPSPLPERISPPPMGENVAMFVARWYTSQPEAQAQEKQLAAESHPTKDACSPVPQELAPVIQELAPVIQELVVDEPVGSSIPA